MGAEPQQLDASATGGGTRHEGLAEDAIGEWLGGEEFAHLAGLVAEVNMRAAEISEKSGSHPDHVARFRRQADVFGAIGRIATRLHVRRPVVAVRVPAPCARRRGAGRPAGRPRARRRSFSRGGDPGDPHDAGGDGEGPPLPALDATALLGRNGEGWIPSPACRQPLVEEQDGVHCGGCASTYWMAA